MIAIRGDARRARRKFYKPFRARVAARIGEGWKKPRY